MPTWLVLCLEGVVSIALMWVASRIAYLNGVIDTVRFRQNLPTRDLSFKRCLRMANRQMQKEMLKRLHNPE